MSDEQKQVESNSQAQVPEDAALEAAPEIPETSQAERTLAQQVAEDEYLMYQQSCKQYQDIEDEIRKTQMLCAPKETISDLIESYDPVTSPKYRARATDLSEKYSHLRRIRGDGNCFYRAVLTALAEKMFYDHELLKKFTERTKEWRGRLIRHGFPELTTGDFCDAIEGLIRTAELGNESFLNDDLNNDSVANYYVAYLRLVASGHLRENEPLYSGFIEGSRSLDQYCKDEIEPMWKEADHIAIIALVNALEIKIQIEYMDQNADGGMTYIVPDGCTPQLFFLYRPGHYDVLYPK
ncbi:unnamed protein product [Bursaphelenchus okinawaensis]|uniref:ubiquitinyl hydrolase 1 n=1 Tax=Bursaphelenchus okinawaensis TaxID=465554 RepID=A0A811LA04_9BILA|nr:unnamed protein product [Bursaphelenchus okinawaensis]CAG9119185.1 unnamed protein product [Bursaphelenchus okinawaensis]